MDVSSGDFSVCVCELEFSVSEQQDILIPNYLEVCCVSLNFPYSICLLIIIIFLMIIIIFLSKFGIFEDICYRLL